MELNQTLLTSFVGGAAVTPHDATKLTKYANALYIGVSGDLSVLTLDGSTLDLTNVPVGILDIQVQRVNDTGTDADEIWALYRR